MINYKKQSAKKTFEMIKPGHVIGLGDGATVLYLTELIAINQALSESLTLTSSSTNTIYRMRELGLKFIHLSELKAVDFYFDGCDQFDQELNALKSAGGIHTIEKILAGMAREFVLIGDFDKYSESLSSEYPLVIEIIPAALKSVMGKLNSKFPAVNLRQRAVVSAHGNYLLELKFTRWPKLSYLNTFLKMLPGLIDHSLFYHMATKAVLSGPDGTSILFSPFKI